MDLKTIIELNPEESFLKADGFDNAIIGYEPSSMRLIYDIDIMEQILANEGMDIEDIIEHLDYNVFGSYVGKKTPIYIRT